MNYYIQQIKERLSISNIVSRYIALKSRGNTEYLGICPFHVEKTPSFTVNNQKQFYHCFGCGAHGDIILFMQNYFNIDYRDALEKLATEAGINLPKNYNNSCEINIKFERYYKVLEYTTQIYQNNLNTQECSNIMLYLESRGLSIDVIKKYRIGYAHFGNTAILNILKQHFSLDDIIESGALRKDNVSGKIYNHFAGRVIFPIFNKNSSVIGFGGRILENQSPQNTSGIVAKYINSHDSEIFAKGHNLYGINTAQDWLTYCKRINNAKHYNSVKDTVNEGSIENKISSLLANDIVQDFIKTETIILVEGYLDVLTLSSYGLENIVAPLGTAVKIEQIKLLWRCSKNPIICFDNDIAGRKAMYRIAEHILPYIESKRTLRFLQLNEEKDPADFVQKNGINTFINIVGTNTIGLADFLFESIVNDVGMIITPENSAELHRRLMIVAEKIENQQLRYEYKKYFNILYNRLTYTKMKSFFQKHNKNKNEDPSFNYYTKNKKYYMGDSGENSAKQILQVEILSEIMKKDTDNNNIAICIADIENNHNEIMIHRYILNALYLTIKFPQILQKDVTIVQLVCELIFEEEVLKSWQILIMLYHKYCMNQQSNNNLQSVDTIEQVIPILNKIYDAAVIAKIDKIPHLLSIIEKHHYSEYLIKYLNYKDNYEEQNLKNDINVEKVARFVVQSLKLYKNFILQKQIRSIEKILLEQSAEKKEQQFRNVVDSKGNELYQQLINLKVEQKNLMLEIKDCYELL